MSAAQVRKRNCYVYLQGNGYNYVMPVNDLDNAGAGEWIRQWRKVRKLSQANLAQAAQISPRHLSFIETGRAQPGRASLLKLGRALNLSYRQQNRLFEAAGYSAYFPEPPFEAVELAPVWDAVSQVLNQHEPFPAVVLNVHYDILWSNHGFQKMIFAFAGRQALEEYPNLLRLAFASGGLHPFIENPGRFEQRLLMRLYDEAVTHHQDELWALYKELSDQVLDPENYTGTSSAASPIFSFALVKDALRLDLFSTTTSFNLADSVTVQEMRIESYFPADGDSREQYLNQFENKPPVSQLNSL